MRRIAEQVIDLPLGTGEDPLRLSLPQLMKIYNVPGFSIVIINDFKIVASKGYGFVSAGSTIPVTTQTLFQSASISKPVTATAALAFVEQGKLSLNEDVNRKLKSWLVPENDFTRDQKVTLRHLISHISGLSVHGFRGYDIDERKPTTLQILNGEKPANNSPIRVTFIPGSRESYSGGGTVVEQVLLTDISGKEFPQVMDDVVLKKLKMTSSTYSQPLLRDLARRAASGTYSNGTSVHGGAYVYPEMGPAGLWTTPSDLARFAIEIARSRNGTSNRILSQKMTEIMLTRWTDGGAQCFHMNQANPGQFSHNGANEGFQATLSMNWKTGDGIIMMANSNNGEYLWDPLLRRVAAIYGWNYRFSDPLQVLPLIAKTQGGKAALRYLTVHKQAGDSKTGESEVNRAGYMLLADQRIDEAITLFIYNVQQYPQSFNAYDSLAEGYMKAGQTDLAIRNYEKSLELNDKNENAREMLRKLRK